MNRYSPILLCLLAGCASAKATPPDFRALVASCYAQAVLADDSPAPAPVKPKVPRAECKVCNGTGKVRTGDGLAVVDCSNCFAPTAPAPEVKPQAPITILIPPAKPSIATNVKPARTLPATAAPKSIGSSIVYYGGCAGGSCAPQRLRLYVRRPVDRTQQAASGDCTDGSCGTSQQSYSSGGRRRGGLLGRFFGR